MNRSRIIFNFSITVALVATMVSCTGAGDGTQKDQDHDDVTIIEEDDHVSAGTLKSEEDSGFDVVRFDNIQKSDRDKRSYRGLILSNELRVVLISDPDTDMAAASLTVRCGFMHDHKEVPGMAHFMEHMLLMGSVKYPDVDHFKKFVTEHAGRENGNTGENYQKYYFDVSSDNLVTALDIMAQMFLEPLMDPSVTERELKAVDSEMDMYLVGDLFPFYQLKRSLSKPGHPHAKFNNGNKKSLETDPQSNGINVHAELREMYSKFYSSRIMYLAVLGKDACTCVLLKGSPSGAHTTSQSNDPNDFSKMKVKFTPILFCDSHCSAVMEEELVEERKYRIIHADVTVTSHGGYLLAEVPKKRRFDFLLRSLKINLRYLIYFVFPINHVTIFTPCVILMGAKSSNEVMKFRKITRQSIWSSSDTIFIDSLLAESLHELEKIVVPLFEKVKNKDVPSSVYTEHPWGVEQLNRKVYYVPKKDVRKLMLSFPLPDPTKYYKNKPVGYLGHLLGHEGQGSLFAELKDRSWIDSLRAGYDDLPGFAYFEITMELTEKAMNHVDEIVKLVFQYVYLLRTEGVEKRVFEEIKRINEQGFKFKDTKDPFNYVKNISWALFVGYPFKDILSFDVAKQWNDSVINGFLDYITPENMNILIGSKSFEREANLEEPWFRTKYSIQMISEDLINETWKITQPYDKFHLPPPNEYISETFNLYPLKTNDLKFPRIIHESRISRFWFKQDDEFKIPKFYVRFNISSPVTCLHIRNEQLSEIFTHLFVEMFTTRAGYAAGLAGLSWKLDSITCALRVTFSGYTEKLPLFTKIFLDALVHFELNEEKFKIQREFLNRKYKNFDNKQPYDHGLNFLDKLVYNKDFSMSEYHATVKTLNIDGMKKLMKQIFSRVFINGFIYGNCDEKLAKDVINTIESTFAEKSVVLAGEIVFGRVLELEDGLTFVYEAQHKRSVSSAYAGYFQIGSADHPDKTNLVLTELFARIAGKKCFKTLRTDEQLGYAVWCYSRTDDDAVSFMVLLQSGKHPAYVHWRVETFLKNLHQRLVEMSQEEFETNKTSLRDKYLEKILGQKERFDRFWREIAHRRYDFERNETKVSILNSLTKEDIVEFFETHIDESSSRRKKIDIYVTSEVTKPSLPDERPTKDEGIKIDNFVAFNNERATFAQTFHYMVVDPPGTQQVQLYVVE